MSLDVEIRRQNKLQWAYIKLIITLKTSDFGPVCSDMKDKEQRMD